MLIIYLLFCNRHSIVLTIQNVCRLDFLQVQRGRCGKTLLDREKRLLSFQKKHLFVFYVNNHLNIIKTFWFDEWSVLGTSIMWVATSRKQVTNRLCIAVFSRKTSLNRTWNLFLPKSCLIHDFNCVTHGKQHDNRKRKHQQFWIILWRALELLKGK